MTTAQLERIVFTSSTDFACRDEGGYDLDIDGLDWDRVNELSFEGEEQ